MKLLHIDSSALGGNSVTRELTAAIVAQWQAAQGGVQVQYRDLDTDPLPHLTGASLAGADAGAADVAERVLQEFLDADVVVIGAPMYNFAIPSTLKAWIDRIAVAGRTFRYTAEGPQGMAGPKKVVVASARGSVHGAATDFQEPYLRQVMAFIGIHDVDFIHAEGLNMSADFHEKGVNQAKAKLAAVA